MDDARPNADAAGPAANAAWERDRIDLAYEPEFTLGALRIQPATRQLFANGQAETLEPRVTQVLALLARRRGEVVSRDELVECCWQGRAVSEDAINRAIAKVRRIAGARGGFDLETIPRVGYRLTEQANEAVAAPNRRRIRIRAAAAALLLIVIAGAILWLTLSRAEPGGAQPVSVAVLPFRNLSPGDAYFAEGVAEEVLTQLARQPGLRVVGRTSSWAFRDNGNLREVGRRLDVAYVLEGSVRRERNRVRVDVALVETRDGIRRWSETFEGSLDDIFAIQTRIGSAVVGNLRREIVLALPPSGPLATSGELYSLYLTARGQLRSRMSLQMRTAVELLRRVVREDPNYAPAWATLATGTMLTGAGPDQAQAQRQAIVYARRALALAPDLAEAHGAMGLILGFDTDGGFRHFERAVRLDPNSAELQFWLGNARTTRLDFAGGLAAYRRSVEIDPFWARPLEGAALLLWSLDRRDEARGYVRQLYRGGNTMYADYVRGQIAMAEGDLSEAARLYVAVVDALPTDGRERNWMHDELAVVLASANDFDRASRVGADDRLASVLSGRVPDLAELRGLNPGPVNIGFAKIAVVAMIEADGARELLALYDSSDGLLGISGASSNGREALVENGPLVAVVLREAGRPAEAERILARTRGVIAQALRQGPVPRWFLAQAAQTFALSGNPAAALTALERGMPRGWSHTWPGFPFDIAREPAFASLRGHPRFERIAAMQRAIRERERRELESIRL